MVYQVHNDPAAWQLVFVHDVPAGGTVQLEPPVEVLQALEAAVERLTAVVPGTGTEQQEPVRVTVESSAAFELCAMEVKEYPLLLHHPQFQAARDASLQPLA